MKYGNRMPLADGVVLRMVPLISVEWCMFTQHILSNCLSGRTVFSQLAHDLLQKVVLEALNLSESSSSEQSN